MSDTVKFIVFDDSCHPALLIILIYIYLFELFFVGFTIGLMVILWTCILLKCELYSFCPINDFCTGALAVVPLLQSELHGYGTWVLSIQSVWHDKF